MLYLLLTIISNVFIFIILKSFVKYKINTLQAIVFNYWTCVIIGFIYFKDIDFQAVPHGATWVKTAFFLGFLFIATFYLMALTTQRISVSAASVANKMSLVIPVGFSLFVFNNGQIHFSMYNYIGIVFAIISILLVSFRKEKKKDVPDLKLLLLPIFVFIFSGTIDTFINKTKLLNLNPSDEAIFPILIFFISGMIGLVLIGYNNFFKKELIVSRNILAGMALGIPNFFSLIFLMRALEAYQNQGALLFPLVNIGTILLATFLAILLFKEKLTFLNKAGIVLAIIALFLLKSN